MSAEAEPTYTVTCDAQWTTQAYHLLMDGRLQVFPRGGKDAPGFLVTGPCPRCDHHLVDRRALLALTGMSGTRGGSGGAPERFILDITCGCGTTHQGAPEGVTGCGASFRIEMDVQ